MTFYEETTRLFHMPLLTMGLLGILTALLSLAVLIVSERKRCRCQRLKKSSCKTAITSTISLASLLCAVLVIMSAMVTYRTAYAHGYRGTNQENAASLWNGIHATPAEDTPPDDKKNKILLFYRFGCPACEDSFLEIKDALAPFDDNVYWIASRSETGKLLTDQYQITSVPRAIIVTENKTLTYYLPDQLDELVKTAEYIQQTA